MSTRVSRGGTLKVSGHRKNMVLGVDLNVPPSDIINEVGTSSHVPRSTPQVQASQQGSVPQVAPIDVDSFDDDVVFCSPRAFEEAKNNSRRNRTRNNVVDVDRETTSRNARTNRSKRQRIPTNQPILNCESYVVSSVNNNSMSGKNVSEKTKSMAPPPPPPPPPEPIFKCPVCMGALVEEVTTKCGHIFCRACIKKSISTQGKCPTCRRKVTMKDTIRIYLPATT